MSSDDPFSGPEDESERTVIRPSPGGRRPPIQAARAPEATAVSRVAASEQPRAVPTAGVNPLIGAASPLLHLAVRLKGMIAHPDVDGLHARVINEIKAFEQRALEAGIQPEAARAGRYALCATIDDLVLNTPWGSNSLWTRQGMVSVFHKETFGGERFFELLDAMRRDPARNLDTLELFYLCLNLGFEGRLRVTARGAAERAEMCSNLYREIRQRRGEFEHDLAPHWRGIDARHKPFHAQIPLWVVAVVLALVLTLIYGGLSFALNGGSDRASALLGAVPPTEPLNFVRPAPALPPPPVAPAAKTQLTRIKGFLEDEIKKHLVTVLQTPDTITIRIAGKGMFASGSDRLDQRFMPILVRVGNALNSEAGKVLVAGYTDNVPIRTLRFPSNWQLSEARAKTVERLLAQHLKDPGRLSVQGFGDAHPIASNATPDGREANRRIEVVLTTAPGTEVRVEPAPAGK